MSKQINAAELAEIVSKLLANPTSSRELVSGTTFACFMTEIAKVVCDYCGGEVRNQADDFTEEYLVELAEIVSKLLTNPMVDGELVSSTSLASFMTQIAKVVCNFCGGEVKNQADNFAGEYIVGVHGNDSLPEGGGIWADYDEDGEL